MRRTSEFWPRLEPWERSWLVMADRGKTGSYGGGGYLPDDCSDCSACGNPMLGCGMCGDCCNQYDAIIAKGEGRINVEANQNN